MNSKTIPLRPNVCLFILNSNNEVFIGERLDSLNAWQLPQGGIENDGSIQENALREANEETGADASLFAVEVVLKTINEYDFQEPKEYLISATAEKAEHLQLWKGQRQNFVVLRFLGKDQNFNLNRYHAEFSDWCWVPLNELLEKIIRLNESDYLIDINSKMQTKQLQLRYDQLTLR